MIAECPECKASNITFWKDYSTSEVWHQNNKEDLAAFDDSDQGEMHPVDNLVHFHCNECSHRWDLTGDPLDFCEEGYDR